MKVKCRFCEFSRPQKFSRDIVEVIADPSTPQEDRYLWQKRFAMTSGTRGWNGVKVHMGRMHKEDAYYGMWPDVIYTEDEIELMKKAGMAMYGEALK